MKPYTITYTIHDARMFLRKMSMKDKFLSDKSEKYKEESAKHIIRVMRKTHECDYRIYLIDDYWEGEWLNISPKLKQLNY